MKQELLVLVDSHPLTAGKEPNYESSRGQNGYAEKGVRGSVHYCDLSEDWAEVGIMGAVEPCAVSEDDMKGPLPTLRRQVELDYRVGIGDGDIGATVHYAWFVYLRTHSGGYCCRVLGGWSLFFVGVQ